MDNMEKSRRRVGWWRTSTIILGIALMAVLVVLIVIILKNGTGNVDGNADSIFVPCPPQKGGLLTSGDPSNPSPFHDITVAEYQRLYEFLRKEPTLNLASPGQASVSTANIFMVDLLIPAKMDVLHYLDTDQGQQPPREARVVIFRGDKSTPVVEEYRVGPLSNPSYAELLVNSKRRNPVQFSVRPLGGLEFSTVHSVVMAQVDATIGHILMESYGGKFTECGDNCLSFYPTPVGTGLIGHMERKIWFWGNYPAEYYSLYPLDFGVRVALDGSDPTQWQVDKVWYSGTMYSSLQHLADAYANVPGTNKTKLDFVHTSPELKTTQNLRGDPVPPTPQRPPVQVEPDGKRYSIEHRHVKYMHWDFDIRLSAFTGPQVYDVRYHNERIVYELGVSEIAVYYSGDNPIQRVTDFVDSGALIGTHSKSLIPGADCPESATFLSVSFLGEGMDQPTTLARAVCVFEQDTGVPLRRHLSYARDQGAFYGGMADSVLTVRSILTIVNYDYIVDFIFHQSGAIETRVISTGYILATFYRDEELPYGFRLDHNIIGNIHQHMFHFKADLDIGGTSNRYETLDMSYETVPLRQIGPSATYRQIRYDRHPRRTEREAVYKFNFDQPKYHIVHNNMKKTEFNAPRAYRIYMAGLMKQLLPMGEDNEVTIPWARQQLAVTVQNDEELVSSSPYAMFDSLDPVTNFSSFISDESIEDEDLVFWITLGTQHIPHTEDIPVTPTVGGHLSFFLLPYNYFPECPSVSSRDNIRVEYATPHKPADGLKVERNGNQVNSACGAMSLEQLVKEQPDDIIQTHREFKLL